MWEALSTLVSPITIDMRKLNCILLVDDDIPTNYYNKKIIEKLDCAHHVEACTSGEAALEFLRSDFSSGNPPQPELIFLDINMPGMNGFEFLDEYEKLPAEFRGKVVIMMLTTSVNPHDEERANEKGIKGFVRKPLDKEMLTALIQEHFG